MYKNTIRASAVFFLLSLAGLVAVTQQARAATDTVPLHIGVALGSADTDNATPDSSDSSFKVFISLSGREFSCAGLFCGAEVGFINFGKVSTDIVFVPAANSESFEAQAIYGSLTMYGIKLSPKSVLNFKAGIFYSWADRTVSDLGVNYSGSGESVDLMLGLGFEYILEGGIKVHANWDSYNGVGGDATLYGDDGFSALDSGALDFSVLEVGISTAF